MKLKSKVAYLLLPFAFQLNAPLSLAKIPNNINFTPVFPSLKFKKPIVFSIVPNAPKNSYVIEQRGKIWHITNRGANATKKLALDINPRLGKSNEEGLLGFALHPNFSTNKYKLAYLYYSATKPRRSVISSMPIIDGKLDPSKEIIILEVKQPWGNHNGGHLAFGPDNYLYIGLGDGGSGGDPHNNGQNLNTKLGSILRIDINKPSDKKHYSIPGDNPFINIPSAQAEIWAYGLRNPWRFSFDQKTNLLYCGDVGQNKYEEVNIIKRGQNYGWRIREGFHTYKAATPTPPITLAEPIAEYTRDKGVSITGGVVYRGKIKSLQGIYLYADFAYNNLWGLRYQNNKVTEQKLIMKAPYNIASFSQDQQGEVYICSYAKGNIFKISGIASD